MDNLIQEIEKRLNIKVSQTSIPPQGMDSQVFILETEDYKKYAIKTGKDVETDAKVFNLINKHSELNIPIPKLFDAFEFNQTYVLVMEKVNYPLMQEVQNDEKHLYVESMVSTLRKIQSIKSDKVGYFYPLVQVNNWKELIQLMLSGNHPWYNWNEISTRESLDSDLINATLEKLKSIVNQTVDFITENYSLLHTDFNQRNLFVNPVKHEIAAVIDWTEAMFGDPLYDLARLKFYPYHFNLGPEFEDKLNNELKLNGRDLQLIDLYFLIQILCYLRWYSDELNDFNLARIQLHQKILREYNWKKLTLYNI